MKKIATSHTAFFRLFFLCLLLMAGVSHLWADQSLYEVYMVYEFNGSTNNYSYYSGDKNNNPVLDLGTLTSNTFKIKEVYWKTNDNWKTHKINAFGWYNLGSGDVKFAEYTNYTGSNTDDCNCNHEIQNTNVNYTVATANTGNSGLFTFSHWWIANFHWNDDSYNPTYCTNNSKNYNFTFNILPPNATAITATPTGAISGDGSELDPYIVPYGGDLTIALSGSTKERSDDNSEVQYSIDGGSTYGTSDSYISKTLSNVTATTLQNYVFKARCYNSTASLESPSITTKTVYYKAARGVPVYKFVTKSSDLGTDPVCAAANTDYPLTTSDALTTLAGGTLTARASTASSKALTYNTSNIKFTSSAAGWLILGLNTTIKEGDVIRYINSFDGIVALQTTKGTNTNQIELPGIKNSTQRQTVAITADQATAFAGLSTVYLARTDGTSYISYIEILRPYAVTLDANTNGGKIGGENTSTMYFKADEPQALPHATKTDYRFKGWYTTSDGNTKASNPYTATANTTLYAQWEDCPSSGSVYKFQVGTELTNGSVTGSNVAFDFNVGNYLSDLEGGTLGTEGSKAGSIQIADENCISIGDGAAYLKIDLDCATEVGDTIKTIVTTKTAYLHHSATSEATMTIATSANTSTYQKQVIPAALEDKSTLYLFRGSGTCKVLYFEIIRPVKYTITYNAGTYGTGSIDAGTKIYNGDFTLSSSTFSRAGATQDGWATSDGGDKAYELGGTYTTNADITLYPHWVHTITYHSATADDYVIENIEDGAEIDDAYIPAYCAPDRVFVGWATSEVSTQQSEPTIVSEDGTFDEVTADMDLYAVFANRSGGKVTDSVTVSEGFETYSMIGSGYTGTNRKFNNSTTGLSWIIDYGNVTTGGNTIFTTGKDVIVNAKYSGGNLRSSSPVEDVISISLRSARNYASLGGSLKWTTDTASWPGANTKVLSIAANNKAYKDSVYFKHPQRTFIKIINNTIINENSRYLYIDSIVFTKAVANYYLTDYSTTCTSGSAAITWENNGGTLSVGTQPTDTAIRAWKKLPTLTRANYRFDGWKATINGELKSDVYEAGEWFLIGHDVTFTAQWTRYIEDIEGVSPITTGNGIAVRSYEIDSIVVNSESATTPTANIVGDDAALFSVTIDAANKRVADGKTHFPYYVTYTPDAHNEINSVDISFTCDDVESSAITVQGRSLPEEFVIAVKKGDGTWVALPNTIVDNSKAITPIEIAVDNTTTPTEATFAPNSTVYKTDTRYAVGANVYGIRFTDGVLKESKYNHLQVSSSSGTNYVWLSYTGSSTCQDWLLQSEDMSVYKLKVPTSGAGDKKFGLYSSNIGYYSSPSNSDIYLLPIENKAEQYEATVTTWSQSHIEVTLTEALEYDADEVIAKLAETSYGATAITGGGTQYGLTFEGIDLAGKNGQKLLLTWKKNGSVIGWSTISIPRIVAQSAEQDTWSKINPKASDIVVLNYPATVGTLKGVAKEVVLADGGQLVISANKALVVTGKITREDGSPTTAADLVIKSTSSGNGTLIFENDGNEATVEMYSKASAAAKPWSWQYMAVPFTSTNPLSSYYGSYMYEWPSDCSTWQPVTRNTALTAFTGYLISNPSANYTYSMEGELAPTEDDVVIDVPAGKEMVVGNSWTGPIQITQMTTEDFSKVTATIYLFNTGMDSEEQGAATPDAGDRYAPGTYVTIPINEAEDVGVTKISSLQGFYVEQNKTEYAGQNGSLTLSYSKHVRPAGANTVDNGPMHAPKRVNAEERPTLLKIKVSGSRYDDRLILLEREDFSTGFDNGWDGKKLDEQGAQPMLYTTRPDGTPDAVSAIPEMDGTVISFHPGEDNTYTLRFEYAEENDELYIVDTQTTPMQTTRVLSGNTYTFNTSNNDTPARFLLTRSNAPQTATGVEPTPFPSGEGRGEASAKKLILNQQLYIYRNGILFDATGRRVDNFSVGSGFDANANANAEQEKGGAE